MKALFWIWLALTVGVGFTAMDGDISLLAPWLALSAVVFCITMALRAVARKRVGL